MATPTSISGLPALLNAGKGSLSGSEAAREAKNSDVPTTDSVPIGQQYLKLDDEAVQKTLQANNDAVEGENCSSQKLEDSKNQSGLKPPRSGEKKSNEHIPSCFRENLESGIPIESDDKRISRSVFGFGLSDEQENALYQYISNRSGKRPHYEPDREALADCWGSPEPEREVVNDSEEEEIPVVFSADLSQTLPPKELSKSDLSAHVVFGTDEENAELIQADDEGMPDAENEVDVASTESLYEGEGGVDLGSRPVSVEPTANIDDEEKREDHGEAMNEEMDRLLIMEKVKECYGLGVKTSLERVMRKGDPNSISTSKGSCNHISCGKPRERQDAPIIVIGKDDSVASPTASEMTENESFATLWEDECMRYLERAPEFRARLQYEVRVILISPAFHFAGRTVSAFSRLYEKKFGRIVDTVGFSTAARLCRSMPHVVQRALLIDEGKLQLVDTPKNHRIVAGIRSGLRRIVYDILRTHQGIAFDAIGALFNKGIGQPLNEVLIDHGYHTASVECMLRDMPDIAYLDERAEQTRVHLSKGAEDPALTDGLLIRRPSQERTMLGMPEDESKINRNGSSRYSGLLGEENLQSPDDDDADQQLPISPEGPRTGPNGMAPEELSDLRVLCAAESSSPYRDASIYTDEDVSSHVRLRFRLLLALHDEGRGVRIEDMPSVYEKMFAVPLDLPALGFDTLEEFVNAWRDVILVKTSKPGWAFPINTLENNRVLNTVTSGLRSAVFAILLARYPEGLEPLELVECLEETMSGKFWEILSSNGYIFKDMSRTGEALSKGPSDFQLADCSELRLLLKDMEDFVRLGCREDGVLIVKLRDGEFPLLDLQDCEVSEEPLDGKEGQFRNLTDVDAIKGKQTATDSIQSPQAEPSGDLIMAMDVQLPASIKGGDSKAEYEVEVEGSTEDQRLNPLDIKSPGEENPLSPPTSPLSVSELMVPMPEQACSPPHKLKHEARMIFGSPEYMENGLTVEEFCTVYRERTGQPLNLGEFKSVESLLHAMPDIVSFELRSVSEDQMITLVQSRRNMRILSIAKVGLRQVLFWALLKNLGGVWAELLEGWFLDFAGWPLSSALASHGYDKPRCAPLQPIAEFLQDMADILEEDEDDPSLYVWTGLYEDPVLADSSLLGIPVEIIQYDPVKEEYENSRWQTGVIAKAATQLRNKDGKTSVDKPTIPVEKTVKIKISNAEDSDADIQESSCAVLKFNF